MFQCPSCGAHLKFEIESQKLSCDSCGNKYEPKTFDSGEGAKSSEFFDVTVFSCQQCGADLLSTDDSAVGFCSYCGASTVLKSRISNERRPSYITPFKKTKDDCKELYKDVLNRAWYSPQAMRDPKYVDKFRGIYMPYWLYDVSFKPDVQLEAKSIKREGKYEVERTTT